MWTKNEGLHSLVAILEKQNLIGRNNGNNFNILANSVYQNIFILPYNKYKITL